MKSQGTPAAGARAEAQGTGGLNQGGNWKGFPLQARGAEGLGEVSRKRVHTEKRGAEGRPGSTALQDKEEPLELRLTREVGQEGKSGISAAG